MISVRHFAPALAVIFAIGPARADEKEQGGTLKLVGSVPRDELDSVVTALVSPDGKFLYASSWKMATIAMYARDSETGTRTLKQSIADPENLAGVTGLALNADGSLAVATAFEAKTVVLFTRNPESGLLGRVDVARDGENGVRLGFSVDAAFTPDSRDVCAIDDVSLGDKGGGAIVSFHIRDGKLEIASTDLARERCYVGARGPAIHPGGKLLFVSSGRFEGESAVTVFRLDARGRLACSQEFISGKGALNRFDGGNHLGLSPDGLNLYAAAMRSGTVARFRRNPDSGKLTFIATIPDGAQGGELGATSVGFSPDGRFVYVPTEDKKAISIFSRQLGD
jgi:6-phosphogluconolactonase (cycloisomerase 2 family)